MEGSMERIVIKGIKWLPGEGMEIYWEHVENYQYDSEQEVEISIDVHYDGVTEHEKNIGSKMKEKIACSLSFGQCM